MNDWQNEPRPAAIENIVRLLREHVRLDETFDVRVMSAVHAEALARVDAAHTERTSSPTAAGWWRKQHTLRFSNLGALAIAASILAVIFLGSTTLSRLPATTAAARPANAQNVHFILVDGAAQQVYLVGDFNGWSKTETPLVRAANGNSWTVAVPLSQGRHEYAFIVSDENGDRWVADPLGRIVEDEFGTESSVIRVEPGNENVKSS
jgi:hypothetical protein